MRRFLIAAVFAAGIAVAPAPAFADHGGYRDGCGEQGDGCGNEREERYENSGCKYVCPSFERSPVHDAFNFAPVICLPGSTCTIERSPEESPPAEQRASSTPNPACLVPVPFHCDPAPSG